MRASMMFGPGRCNCRLMFPVSTCVCTSSEIAGLPARCARRRSITAMQLRLARTAELSGFDLPKRIGKRLAALVRAMNLEVAGVDLRWTPDKLWYCFEVNPSPGFTWYEEHTGHPNSPRRSRICFTAEVPICISPTELSLPYTKFILLVFAPTEFRSAQETQQSLSEYG